MQKCFKKETEEDCSSNGGGGGGGEGRGGDGGGGEQTTRVGEKERGSEGARYFPLLKRKNMTKSIVLGASEPNMRLLYC